MARKTKPFTEFTPVRHMPGSAEKIETFTQRWASGLPLFHPQDSYDADRDGPYEFATIPPESSHGRGSVDRCPEPVGDPQED